MKKRIITEIRIVLSQLHTPVAWKRGGETRPQPNQTKYRAVSNGYWYFLEYKKKTFFSYKWERIWWPYYDELLGRQIDCTGAEVWVCDMNNNLENFVTQWPCIEAYFEWAKPEQAALEKKASVWKEELERKKCNIIYF
jgi:hypothetical protein